MYTPIEACRICGNSDLVEVLDLGEQMLTGVFPKSRDQQVTTGPLRLVKCVGDDKCGLLQLAHSYSLGEMYGDNYGYRSGLNPSMVAHLKRKVMHIQSLIALVKDDLVIDIGSNDSTTLRAYDNLELTLVGIDPTGEKFRSFYPSSVRLIPDFFSQDVVEREFPGRKARVVTSFSMFYDLESPMEFMRQVANVLADDGIWVFEQSYMPLMLKTNSYDTVCHEHLEFYGLTQIKWMTDRVGLRIIDVQFNDVNGGSFSITAAKAAGDTSVLAAVQAILDREIEDGLDTLAPYRAFSERTAANRKALLDLFQDAKREGKTIGALGASTKGNVLLQYCCLTQDMITAVGEVNPDKFGRFTPGVFLPIIEEQELLAQNPDYLLVLPWHFREFFENSPAFEGRKLLFPLPEVEVVEARATDRPLARKE